jgi:hypothetical protein
VLLTKKKDDCSQLALADRLIALNGTKFLRGSVGVNFSPTIRFLCFILLIFAPLAPLSQVTPLTHEEGKFRLQESVGFKP